uniref:Variant surface glycoprotein 1125.4150 n=1 Tax=Trypanosoma brucei TaxID=5691 RepID=A0A1J0R9Y4_9TRYP|nr:variant surface glycoprotein 1125.4150 [Trypanosoma brucei]
MTRTKEQDTNKLVVKARFLASFTILLGVITMRRADAIAACAIKKKNWEEFCDTSKDLDKIQQLALQRLNNRQQSIRDLQTALLKLQIYVEKKAGGNLETELLAIAELYATKLNKLTEIIANTETAVMLTVVRDTARLQGAIDEFMSFAVGVASSSKGCLSTGNSNEGIINGRAALDSAKPSCKLTTGQVTPGTTEPTKITATGYKIDNRGKGQTNTITGTDTGCDLNSAKASSKLLDDGSHSAITTAPFLAGGFLTIGASGIEQTDAASATALASKRPLTHAAHAAVAATADPSPAFTLPDLKSLATDEDFTPIARRLFLNKTANDASSDDSIANKLTAAYTDQTTYDKKLKTNINNEEIPKGISGDENNPKNLGTINDIAQLYRIFFYYKETNAKALESKITELQKTINKGASKTPEQICNDIGDSNESKCNTTKGCAYDRTGEENKKCTLSEEGIKAAAKQEENKAGVKDGETDSKCSDKKTEGECKDGFKWDGKEYKDSGFSFQ